MELDFLIQLKLKNDILKDIQSVTTIEITDELLKCIDEKIKANTISIDNISDESCNLDDNERCCTRTMGKKYKEKRCESKRCKGDYCLKHYNMIQKQGYLSFKRYDEPRPMINESGNKIPWRDNTEMEDINTLIKYQNMKLLKLIK